MWVLYQRVVAGMFGNTNNGVERMNRTLKKKYLQDRRNNSLSRLVEVLVCDYGPSQLAEYVRAQKTYSRPMKITEGLPAYLQYRPSWFVNHCLDRLKAVDGEFTAGMVEEKPDNVVEVVSGSGANQVYTVLVNSEYPSCNCLQFKKKELPCKHLFAALKFSSWTWDDLHDGFRNHPLFTVDESVLRSGETVTNPIVAFDCLPTEVSGEDFINPPEAPDIPEFPAAAAAPVPDSPAKNPRMARQAIMKCKSVWKDIEGLLFLNDSPQIAAKAEEMLRSIVKYLDDTVQGGVSVQSGAKKKKLLRMDLPAKTLNESRLRKQPVNLRVKKAAKPQRDLFSAATAKQRKRQRRQKKINERIKISLASLDTGPPIHNWRNEFGQPTSFHDSDDDVHPCVFADRAEFDDFQHGPTCEQQFHDTASISLFVSLHRSHKFLSRQAQVKKKFLVFLSS
jgi:hypothetical protein